MISSELDMYRVKYREGSAKLIEQGMDIRKVFSFVMPHVETEVIPEENVFSF
jgi:hypothetical protein